jgi:hypothetical protein
VLFTVTPEAREVLQAASIRQRPASVEVIQLAFCLVVAQRLLTSQHDQENQHQATKVTMQLSSDLVPLPSQTHIASVVALTTHVVSGETLQAADQHWRAEQLRQRRIVQQSTWPDGSARHGAV